MNVNLPNERIQHRFNSILSDREVDVGRAAVATDTADAAGTCQRRARHDSRKGCGIQGLIAS